MGVSLRGVEVYLLSLSLGVVAYLVWRLRKFFGFSSETRRWFYGFWLWPVLLASLHLIPAWLCRSWIYDTVWLLLVLGMAVDFIYFFGFKTPHQRHQSISALLFVPYLLFLFWDFLPGERVILNLPHHGKAFVWTDRFFAPRSYYFLNEKALAGRFAFESNEQTLYFPPVFSPLTGQVGDMDEKGMLRLYNEKISLHIGPMIKSSLRVRPGMKVFANQPLGILAGETDREPSIQIRFDEPSDLRVCRFKDVLVGRLWARQGRAVLPARNQLVTSDSPTRFRFDE